MTAYYEILLTQGQFAALGALCQFADESESKLERVRVKLGFHEDWSPSYDRTQAAPPRSDVSWGAKYASCEGSRGNMGTLFAEICAWADIISEKWAEVASIMDEPAIRNEVAAVVEGRAIYEKLGEHHSAKRGPGRPRKEA